MLVYWQGLDEEVREIINFLAPSHGELLHTDTVSNPVFPHVDAFGALGFDRVIDYPVNALVVTEH